MCWLYRSALPDAHRVVIAATIGGRSPAGIDVSHRDDDRDRPLLDTVLARFLYAARFGSRIPAAE